MRRASSLAAAALAVGLGVAAPALEAQDTQRGSGRLPRKLVFSAVGTAIGAGVAFVYSGYGKANTNPGSCTSSTCVSAVVVGAGALIGYMIGREFDQLHELRYRGGAPIAPPTTSVPLEGEAFVLVVRDSLVAVGGTAGVQLFRSGPSGFAAAGKRAAGIRGISALDIAPGDGVMALGAPAGVYVYPPLEGPGLLLRPGAATAAAASRDRLFFAVDERVEVAPLDADSARVWPGIDLGSAASSMALDERRGILWVAVDSQVVALRPAGDSLERVGSIAVGARPRRIALDGTRLAAALGETGVRIFDVADPAAARGAGAWSSARFVYDVSLVGSRLFAAAGVEGVYVVELDRADPETLGLARELGFATALASGGGFTFVLDRNAGSLRRIPSGF